VLALHAAGAEPRRDPLAYLHAHESELEAVTDVELVLMAEAAAGAPATPLVARLHAAEQRSGAIGGTLNSTVWGILALAQAGEAVPKAAVRYVLAHQSRSGGWSWVSAGAPDSNDTAAAVEALRAARVGGTPVARALRFLLRFQRRDGGFGLTRTSSSDAQSTAWALQAFAAAGVRPPRGARAYLLRLRRRDGSFRYSARYAITPTWVTAQVLPALERRPFPLR
jgi:prenyltransferase beta subunit